MKHVLTVTSSEMELALASFLGARLRLEPAIVEGWVRAGAVYVDGSRERRPEARLRTGQRVIAHEPAASAVASPRLEPRVAYRDDDLAVLDKPAGLASMPLRHGGDSVVDWLAELLGAEARLLHRLDRDTSGLLLCAISKEARRSLGRDVAGHHLLRGYLAIVAGEPAEAELSIRSRLSARRDGTTSSQDPRAGGAVTHVRLVRRIGGRALVEATLETGRTHQIRAHLSEAKLPVVGDVRYGGPPAPRLALHAHRLAIRAPTGRWLDLHSPLPAEMIAMLKTSATPR